MLEKIIEITHRAGDIILEIYNQPSFKTMNKEDRSPLTEADTASHLYITQALKALDTNIPIISEEDSKEQHYNNRKDWQLCFLVDPLDGTKEFIKRNGEFTINIALIKDCQPVLGVIYAPDLGTTYYAEKGKGAFKIIQNQTIILKPHTPNGNNLRVVASRSHHCEDTQLYLEQLKSQGKEIETKSAGSALKFGLVAEGSADIYPRFAPTMEWDTAAGHIIVNEVGKKVIAVTTEQELSYNKENLRNPGFIVS